MTMIQNQAAPVMDRQTLTVSWTELSQNCSSHSSSDLSSDCERWSTLWNNTEFIQDETCLSYVLSPSSSTSSENEAPHEW